MSLTDLLAQADPAAFLADYKVVLLAESNLDASGEHLFRDYVTGGGSLIAMSPDPGLGRRRWPDLRRAIAPRANLEFLAVDTEPAARVGHLRPVDAIPRRRRELRPGRC